MKNNKKIIIIGAGISGLTAAAILSKKGFSVTVLEKNDKPGGVAGKLSINGFTFDTGPTWYLMPDVYEHLFSTLQEPITRHLKLIKLDPSFKVFFRPDEKFLLSPDMKKNQFLFETFEKNGSQKLKAYLQDAAYKYRIAMEEFLYKDYRSIFDFITKRMLTEGLPLQVFRNLDAFAKKFFNSPEARKILEYNTVFLGCSPYKIPAIYSLMSHVDLTQGVFYPHGGIYAIVEALKRIAEENGSQFYFNEAAIKIHTARKKAVSVETEKNVYDADIIIAACDYHHTEKVLLAPHLRNYTSSYWGKRTLAPSAFMLYLGVNKILPELEHHNLFLADKWENHFSEIFTRPAWPGDPSFYVGCPSKTDASTAPPNCESLIVLVPVAPDLDDTNSLRQSYAEKILSTLERLIGTSIKDAVIEKKIRTITDFQRLGNLYKGTALGLSHTLRQTACFRPSHRNKKVSNLYYIGHYTHPGIGMPMVVISAQIVSNIIMGNRCG